MPLLLDPDRGLMRGIPTQILDSNYASGASGVVASHAFSLVKDSMPGGDTTFQIWGPGLTVTAFNGIIEQTLNQGGQWSKLSNFDLIVTPALTVALLSGVVYRFNITTATFTGGATGPTVLANLG